MNVVLLVFQMSLSYNSKIYIFTQKRKNNFEKLLQRICNADIHPPVEGSRTQQMSVSQSLEFKPSSFWGIFNLPHREEGDIFCPVVQLEISKKPTADGHILQ